MSNDYSYHTMDPYQFGHVVAQEALKRDYYLPRSTVFYKNNYGDIYSPVTTRSMVEVFIKGKRLPEASFVFSSGHLIYTHINLQGNKTNEVINVTSIERTLGFLSQLDDMGKKLYSTGTFIGVSALQELIPGMLNKLYGLN